MKPQMNSLDKKKVAEARREEMKHFEAMGVYKKVPYAQAIERTGRRPIGIMWVDVKKADGRQRRRQVAKEFSNGIDQTMRPPLEALKMLTVKLAAREPQRRDTKIAPGDDVDVHNLRKARCVSAWTRRCLERGRRHRRGRKKWRRRCAN